MTCKALRKAFKIEGLPIILYERKMGRLKLNWDIILQAILGILRLRLGR